jgi:hypothetical protein
MKQLLTGQETIVRRAWDKLGETSFGYLPRNDAPDGFYTYAEAARGDEWSLITAVKARVTRDAKG